MTGHNTYSAEFLKNMGFSRMVCAREMSKENIDILVKNSPIEIEMFVHGAMCVSQSGQCLMSSFIGNRSGNRGECAQPCRLPYNNSYPLSLSDLSLAEHIGELIDSGVASLKIEGRMKSPSYVYTVTKIYRTLIDTRRLPTGEELAELRRAFSRGEFTDGYFTGKKEEKMTGTRSEGDKELSRGAESRRFEIDRIPVRAKVKMRLGEPAEMMYELTDLCCSLLPKDKPRYLMGVGTPVNLLESIALGVDMFDCVMPTRNGRNAMLFTMEGVMNMKNKKWANDFSVLDENGTSFVDKLYTKAYLRHLFVSQELLALQIASIHNLAFYLELMRQAREHIIAGDFLAWKNIMVKKLSNRL